jgi:translin
MLIGSMSLEELKTILALARKDLLDDNDFRETAYKELRKAIGLSKQAILMVHQERLKEAKTSLEKSERIINKVKDALSERPSILYSGLFSAVLQEFSEASIFLELILASRFIAPREINVPSSDYVLGLADVIGECRRAALDALREGKTEMSERFLQTMDQIYIELMALDESYMLVPGLRHKCDVARKIIEITRGDVTQEIRRNELQKHLVQLERRLKSIR